MDWGEIVKISNNILGIVYVTFIYVFFIVQGMVQRFFFDIYFLGEAARKRTKTRCA